MGTPVGLSSSGNFLFPPHAFPLKTLPVTIRPGEGSEMLNTLFRAGMYLT